MQLLIRIHIISLIVFTLTLHLHANAITINCRYSISDWWTLSDVYTCYGTVIFQDDHRIITDVTQNHLDGKNGSDVQRLVVYFQPVEFIPENIADFFPNIEAIQINFGALREISREALIDLRALRQLDFFENNIRTLENGAFDGNPLLAAVNIDYNPIRNVNHAVFDNVPELTSLHIHGATCINQMVNENRQEVENMIFRLSVQCPPTFQMLQSEILKGYDFQRKIDLQIVDRMNPLNYHILELEEMLKQHDARIKELEGQIQNLKNTL